jgi:lipoprotein-anchoring transpeptidase ErfK/SrfK
LITAAEHAEILRANAEGRTPPWKTALGGEVFIHGRGAQSDWTAGCVAMDDAGIAELYDLVEVGTPVIIRP